MNNKQIHIHFQYTEAELDERRKNKKKLDNAVRAALAKTLPLFSCNDSEKIALALRDIANEAMEAARERNRKSAAIRKVCNAEGRH